MVKISNKLVRELRDKSLHSYPIQGQLGPKPQAIEEENMSVKVGKPFDPSHDYTKDLDGGDIREEDGREFVFLRGLEKLARARGVVSARAVRLEPMIMTKSGGDSRVAGIFCTYEYSFVDGGVYQGSADATIINCDGNFKLYLTAMAESRAKARALRTAFGIGMCSVEEKSDATYKIDEDIGPIDDAQIVLIQTLAAKHNLGLAEILELLEVPRKVERLKELTKDEGRELAIKLNKHKPRRRSKRG